MAGMSRQHRPTPWLTDIPHIEAAPPRLLRRDARQFLNQINSFRVSPIAIAAQAHGLPGRPGLGQLRTTGLSNTVQDRILQMFQEASGVGSVSGTPSTYPDAQTRILSGSSDYDCWEIIAERLPALIATDNVETIATADLPNWNAIRDTFTTPSDKWAPSAQIAGQIWAASVRG